MPYTIEGLTQIVNNVLPQGKSIIESMGLPRAAEEAALSLFVDGMAGGVEAQVLQEALSDIRRIGVFQESKEDSPQERIAGDQASCGEEDALFESKVIAILRNATAQIRDLAGVKERAEVLEKFVEQVRCVNAMTLRSSVLSEVLYRHDQAMATLEKHIRELKKQMPRSTQEKG